METSVGLGQLLWDRREAKGLSRSTVAWEMSQALKQRVDQSYVARVEDGGIKRPARDRLEWLAKYLGLPVGEVLRLADYDAEGTPNYGIVPEVASRVAVLPAELQVMLLDFLPALEKMAARFAATFTTPVPESVPTMDPRAAVYHQTLENRPEMGLQSLTFLAEVGAEAAKAPADHAPQPGGQPLAGSSKSPRRGSGKAQR